MIAAKDVSKEYRTGESPLTVLSNVTLSVGRGEFVAIVGPSGSGKTTLLSLLAGLDTPNRGEIVLDGTVISTMSEDERSRIRGSKVGFIFQNFQLIPTLTARENVRVPLDLQESLKRSSSDLDDIAENLLTRVGLSHRMDHYPLQLSGGEQQRVAVARAFSNNPAIVFADEPTGNLDSANGEGVIELIREHNKTSDTTVVLVTHDLKLAELADRVIKIADGKIGEEIINRVLNDSGSSGTMTGRPLIDSTE